MILATLCYVRKDNETLMLFRNKKPGDIHRGKWNGLGGKFEPGESPEECARREVYEESGLIADQLHLRGVLTFPSFDGTNDWIVFVFIIDGFHGDLIDSPEGQLEWITEDRLLTIPLWEGDRIFLPWLNQPDFFSGKFTYEKGTLKDHSVSFYSYHYCG
ncbi:8-oxo-dGTP diphosphatase [bacterium]|nr:8-oxo-dGTP diphosphatase [candidate division CSSED10-310 bacterium]